MPVDNGQSFGSHMLYRHMYALRMHLMLMHPFLSYNCTPLFLRCRLFSPALDSSSKTVLDCLTSLLGYYSKAKKC